MTSIEQELSNEISKAVEQIVAASHRAATLTLDEAFGRGRNVGRASSTTGKSVPRNPSARRTSAQIQELKDRIYRVLCATPGQTMVALAEQVGTSPKQLQVPVTRLKAQGLIRSAGQRQSMRYFPKNSGSAES